MIIHTYKLFLVAFGGAFGSAFRYLISGWSQNLLNAQFFPYGTLTVNVIGCLLIGVLGGVAELRQLFSPETRLILFIGFLGGFTTFSTFGFEVVQFMRDSQFLSAIIYTMSQIILGVGAVYLGFILAKTL